MIADYLYNTPAPPAGSTVAVVLFSSTFADNTSLSAAVQGKTLAQLADNANVIATGESKKTPTAFGGVGKRKKTSIYGRTYNANFEFPSSVDFKIHRNGIARGLYFGLLVNGKVVRGVYMTVALADAEAKATRASFSVDDDPYTSKIRAPGPTGSMLGDMEAVLKISAPLSAPSLIGGIVTATITVSAPQPDATRTPPASTTVLKVLPPTTGS